jgi:hypothetical protein
VDQGTSRVEQPRQGLPHLGGIESGREITFDVADRAFEHVEPVAQRVELRTRHHQLVLAEPELGGPVAGFVMPLPAALPAVLTRAAP